MKHEKKQPQTGHIADPSVPTIRSVRAANGIEDRRGEDRFSQDWMTMVSENRKTEQI